MHTRPLTALILLIALLSPSLAHAADEGWTADMAAAQKAAQASGKDILIDFTGSDWCPPCIALHDDVFSKEEFQKAAAERYELVVMDFPQRLVLPEATQEQNARWARKIGLEGYPTVLLLDAEGRAFGKTVGYSGEGLDAFMGMLDEMQATKAKRDAAFAAAGEATGQTKAEALDRGLSELDAGLLTVGYGPQVDAIVDATDEGSELHEKYTGMKRDLLVREALPTVQEQLEGGQVDEAVHSIDGLIERHRPSPSMRAMLLNMKVGALMNAGNLDAAVAAADEMGKVEATDAATVTAMAQQRAGVYARAGRWEQAVAALDQGVAGTQEVAAKQELLLNKSQVYQFQGDPESSLAALDEALALEGTQPPVQQQILANQAFVLFQLERFDEAGAKLDAAIAAAPDSPAVGDLRNGKQQIEAAKAAAGAAAPADAGETDAGDDDAAKAAPLDE